MSLVVEENEEAKTIKKAQEGDSEAMTCLLEKYKGTVRILARPMFLIDGDKDDLIQEGMIGLFKAIRTYDPEKGASFETFANLCISAQLCSAIKKSNRKKNIPLNSYISIYSKEKREDKGDSEGYFMLDYALEALQQNPEDIVINRENTANMKRKFFSRLSKMEMQVLDCFLKGMTYKEIALQLGKSPKVIDNTLQRVRSKFRKKIKNA